MSATVAASPVRRIRGAPETSEPAPTGLRTRRATVATLAALGALGLLLRLFPIRSVWVDEAISVQQARLPYWTMVRALATQDVHPPLWGSLLWADVRLFGYGPLAIRLPSIALGTASIGLAYLAGRELFDRRAGLAAALLTTISPIAVWYSGEARMYAAYLFFSCAAILGQAMVLRRPGTAGWLLFTLSSTGLLYSHFFSAFQLLAQHLWFAALATARARRGTLDRRRLLVPWLLSGAGTLVLALPLVAFLLPHLSQPGAGPAGGGAATGSISVYRVIANLVWAGWGYHSDAAMVRVGALWPLAMLGVLLLLGRGRSTATSLLALLVVVPLACGYAVGALLSPSFFELRYFISILPPLLLLAGRALTASASRRARALAVAVVSASLLVGLGSEQFSAGNPRLYDYNGAFQIVSRLGRPGDVVVYAPDFLRPVVDYYQPPGAEVLAGSPVTTTPGAGRTTFIVGSYLDEPPVASAVGTALAQLEQAGWTVTRVASLANVTVWVLR